MHHFCVQVFTFHVLLPLSRQQFDRIWIWEGGVALLLIHFAKITFIALDLVVDENG